MTVCLSPNGWNTWRGAAAPTRLLIGTLGGVKVLERAGSEWRLAHSALDGRHISSLTREPKHGGVFAGTHGQGLYFSGDDGITWERRTEGLTLDNFYSVAYAEQDGRIVIYAGTEPAALFRSADYGHKWEEVPGLRQVPDTERWTFPAPPRLAHTKSLTVDPRDQRVIYAGIEQGALLKSTDGGASWREYSGYSKADDAAYRDIHQVLLRPSNPDEIYMTTGIGLYHSADAGTSWERLTGRDSRVGYPDQIAFSPEDDTVLFMAGAAQNPGQWRHSHHASGTVLCSRDGGRRWEPVDRGLPPDMRANVEAMAVAAYPGGFTLFIGDTDGAVYASEDGANSWRLIAQDLTPVSKGDHYAPLRAQTGERVPA